MPADQHRSTQCDDVSCFGGWEDVQWAKDGKSLVTQCAADREIIAFRFDGRTLKRSGVIKTTSFPVSIRTAEP